MSDQAIIRDCTGDDFEAILAIINDGAEAYRGVIPEDRFKEPYMARDELRHEIRAGVRFSGFEREHVLLGVMGVQQVEDVSLIRHAYVRSAHRRAGIGSRLLAHIRGASARPLLIGTWAAADWALRFYVSHGFEVLPRAETVTLLARYWSLPARQVETSVVLADPTWLARAGRA